jgi:hypothetical protein
MKPLLITFVLIVQFVSAAAFADDSDYVSSSPKNPWSDFEVVEEPVENSSPLRATLLWLPNRVLDLLDIFRVDVGLGPAYGGVIRITKYAQAGYREMNPASFRVGLMGRQAPVMIERTNEIGISPAFGGSPKRDICKGEIGIGLDVIAAGAYAGICVDEFVDFVGGIFTADIKDDDLQ